MQDPVESFKNQMLGDFKPEEPRKLYRISENLRDALANGDFGRCLKLMDEMTQRTMIIEGQIERIKKALPDA